MIKAQAAVAIAQYQNASNGNDSGNLNNSNNKAAFDDDDMLSQLEHVFSAHDGNLTGVDSDFDINTTVAPTKNDGNISTVTKNVVLNHLQTMQQSESNYGPSASAYPHSNPANVNAFDYQAFEAISFPTNEQKSQQQAMNHRMNSSYQASNASTPLPAVNSMSPQLAATSKSLNESTDSLNMSKSSSVASPAKNNSNTSGNSSSSSQKTASVGPFNAATGSGGVNSAANSLPKSRTNSGKN